MASASPFAEIGSANLEQEVVLAQNSLAAHAEKIAEDSLAN